MSDTRPNPADRQRPEDGEGGAPGTDGHSPATESDDTDREPDFSSPGFSSPDFSSPGSIPKLGALGDYTPPDFVVPPFEGPDYESDATDDLVPEEAGFSAPGFSSPDFSSPGSMAHPDKNDSADHDGPDAA
ncbi:hypothetical protein AB0M29_39440 [Streptomyces sp. NPDC051976]|uniref:hypothetical protein n=1 Tax=Streptomyces sp. NPDC051976 TaxID=3154947 RepID=UPI003423A680